MCMKCATDVAVHLTLIRVVVLLNEKISSELAPDNISDMKRDL